MDDDARKRSALAALRTWRTWHDTRDTLIHAAHHAGALQTEIIAASGLAKGTVRTVLGAITDDQQGENMTDTAAQTTTTETDPLAPYHHPHFVSIVKETEWGTRYNFGLFTGHEPKPEVPQAAEDDKSLTWGQRCTLSREYRAARTMWGLARFRIDLRPIATKAAPIWQEYARARKAMDAVFADFWETDDNRWRAQLLKLTDAHNAALDAARRWDKEAEELAKLQEDHQRTVGEEHEEDFRQVTPEFGIDSSGWLVLWPEEYRGTWGPKETPAVKDVRDEIKKQEERLQQVQGLAGDQN